MCVVETYPSEALRAELSVELGLTDRQLQMWFCHRRLKDRKPSAEKRQKKGTVTPAAAEFSSGIVHEKVVVSSSSADVANEPRSGLSLFGNVEQQQRVAHKAGTAVPRMSTDLPSMRRYYEPPLAISEQRAIKFVEAQLGEPLRDDGPILGMEFDPLPPGAFGAPIGIYLSLRDFSLFQHSHMSRKIRIFFSLRLYSIPCYFSGFYHPSLDFDSIFCFFILSQLSSDYRTFYSERT